jgi:hypothetical protein
MLISSLQIVPSFCHASSISGCLSHAKKFLQEQNLKRDMLEGGFGFKATVSN